MTVSSAVTCRPLTVEEIPAAADLLARTMPEVPLFRWLMGEHGSDPDLVRWMARVYLGGHVGIGRVQAAVDDAGLVLGVVIWNAPDNPTPPMPSDLVDSSREILTARPDILERQRLLARMTAEHMPPGEFVEIQVGVVDPSLRRTGVPAQLGMPARETAARLGVDCAMSTSDAALGAAHERTHGAVFYDSYPLGDITIYQYVVPIAR